VVAGLVVLLGLAAAAAVWTYLDRREAGARRDLVGVTATYRQSMTSRQEAALKAAAETLNRFLKDQPRSRVAMQAWYFLGNVESQRRNPDTALAAYEQAMRGSDGTITRLSRLGSAYAWEAKGDRRLHGRPRRPRAVPLPLRGAPAREGAQPGAAGTARRGGRDLPEAGR
jgi:cytochrome c-type biogenesis protein CcmH/NrfG